MELSTTFLCSTVMNLTYSSHHDLNARHRIYNLLWWNIVFTFDFYWHIYIYMCVNMYIYIYIFDKQSLRLRSVNIHTLRLTSSSTISSYWAFRSLIRKPIPWLHICFDWFTYHPCKWTETRKYIIHNYIHYFINQI